MRALSGPCYFLEQIGFRKIIDTTFMTREVFEESFKWIAERKIFPEGGMGAGRYEDAVVSLAA